MYWGSCWRELNPLYVETYLCMWKNTVCFPWHSAREGGLVNGDQFVCSKADIYLFSSYNLGLSCKLPSSTVYCLSWARAGPCWSMFSLFQSHFAWMCHWSQLCSGVSPVVKSLDRCDWTPLLGEGDPDLAAFSEVEECSMWQSLPIKAFMFSQKVPCLINGNASAAVCEGLPLSVPEAQGKKKSVLYSCLSDDTGSVMGVCWYSWILAPAGQLVTLLKCTENSGQTRAESTAGVFRL